MIATGAQVDLPPPAPTLSRDPRADLASEWQALAPRTPTEIADFYQHAKGIKADLDAWHARPERQEWTAMLVHVAQEIEAKRIVDIGCGAGHDLHAIWKEIPDAELHGVEPNRAARARHAPLFYAYDDVAAAPIETADLLICIDVLEHVPDPTTFLTGIATRARIGCVLFETTATHDAGTPLHLPENRGWHPGHCLERHGWELVDYTGRVHVWRRTADVGRERASLLLCAYRSVNAEVMTAILALCAGNTVGWRQRTKTGDALIARSRAIIVTHAWRETADDVFLIVDDDITFTIHDADHIVELCRNGCDVIVGAYPVHNGGHMACRFMPGVNQIQLGPTQPPMEIIYGGTGFMAIHRKVLDALIADMPLCHANQPWSFYNLFPTMVIDNPDVGGYELLSEDWGFCELARDKGFKIWLDATVKLKHASTIPVSAANMADVFAAVQKA